MSLYRLTEHGEGVIDQMDGLIEEVTIDQLVFMVANACASHDMQSGPFNMLAELDEEMAAAYRRFARKHVEFLLADVTSEDVR